MVDSPQHEKSALPAQLDSVEQIRLVWLIGFDQPLLSHFSRYRDLNELQISPWKESEAHSGDGRTTRVN